MLVELESRRLAPERADVRAHHQVRPAARASSRRRRCSAAQARPRTRGPCLPRRALADEIDCACVSYLERTLLVLRAGDADDGDGRLPPPDLAGEGIVVFDQKHPPRERTDVCSSPRVRHRTKVTISRRHRGVSGLPRSPAGRTRVAVWWEGDRAGVRGRLCASLPRLHGLFDRRRGQKPRGAVIRKASPIDRRVRGRRDCCRGRPESS